MGAADVILWAIGLYAATGVAFGLWFVVRGVGRIDPTAARAPWSFRLLILPGVAALWPLLLHKYLNTPRPPEAAS